ncbi:MAG: hypothetical protein ACRD93_03725 [Nitrososphaeraceae archaeon]
MSEFAFFRFKSANMLTQDEERNKEEIISLTEQVLDARGIECDARIAKVPEDQLREILEEVRRLRRKKKKKNIVSDDDGGLIGELVRVYGDDQREQHDKEEVVYAA